MKIAAFDQSLVVLKNIQTIVWRKNLDNDHYHMTITFNGSDGNQFFKLYFDTIEDVKKAFDEISKALQEL